MVLQLGDLYAPEWEVLINNNLYKFKPLSLRTFAELEGKGITLSQVTAKAKTDATYWMRLIYFLTGAETQEDQESLMADLLRDPIANEKIRTTFSNSMSTSEVAKEEPTQHKSRFAAPPKIVNPLIEKRRKQAEETEGYQEMDMTFLFGMVRYAGIPLDDLLNMSFRGIGLLSKWLEENPPVPSMGSLL